MAARLHPAPERHREIIDLRRLSAKDLEPLLKEECRAWRSELAWDFEKSADLVRRFVDMSALNGTALQENVNSAYRRKVLFTLPNLEQLDATLTKSASKSSLKAT